MTEHIPQTTCPDCGGIVVSSSKTNQHCNGHWNEEVKFKCGAVFKFSPNLMQVEQYKPCSQTIEQKNVKDKRKVALNKLKKYIKALDVDATFKDTLLDKISYIAID